MFSDVMQFQTTAPSQTQGNAQALLNSTGLLLGPTGTSPLPAESCLVVGGATPTTVNLAGAHLGQLPNGAVEFPTKKGGRYLVSS